LYSIQAHRIDKELIFGSPIQASETQIELPELQTTLCILKWSQLKSNSVDPMMSPLYIIGAGAEFRGINSFPI
jgi:hypothetical protein